MRFERTGRPQICSISNFSDGVEAIQREFGYSGEMAEWLAAQGHEVRVVTAPPYYPQWRGADPNRWR